MKNHRPGPFSPQARVTVRSRTASQCVHTGVRRALGSESDWRSPSLLVVNEVINDPGAEAHARVPPEPDEPWRVRPRHRNRRRSPRRHWMTPLISAVLASLGTIAILQPGNASGPWSPRPSHTAGTGKEMHRSSPSPDAQPLISKRPESARRTPIGLPTMPNHRYLPQKHPHRPAPPPTSSSLHRCARRAGTVRTAARRAATIHEHTSHHALVGRQPGSAPNAADVSLTTPPAGPRASPPYATTSPGDHRDPIRCWTERPLMPMTECSRITAERQHSREGMDLHTTAVPTTSCWPGELLGSAQA